MGIISLNNKDRLYWLGRYSERVYTTIRFFGESFDTLIDRELRTWTFRPSTPPAMILWSTTASICRIPTRLSPT